MREEDQEQSFHSESISEEEEAEEYSESCTRGARFDQHAVAHSG